MTKTFLQTLKKMFILLEARLKLSHRISFSSAFSFIPASANSNSSCARAFFRISDSYRTMSGDRCVTAQLVKNRLTSLLAFDCSVMKGYALLLYKVVSDFGNEKLFGNHASLKLSWISTLRGLWSVTLISPNPLPVRKGLVFL